MPCGPATWISPTSTGPFSGDDCPAGSDQKSGPIFLISQHVYKSVKAANLGAYLIDIYCLSVPFDGSNLHFPLHT